MYWSYTDTKHRAASLRQLSFFEVKVPRPKCLEQQAQLCWDSWHYDKSVIVVDRLTYLVVCMTQRKFYFTDRIVNTWTSLLSYVVSANTLNCLKNRLDKYCLHVLVRSSILVSKLKLTSSFTGLYRHSLQSLPRTHRLIPLNIDIRRLEVSVVWTKPTGECGGLTQPSWLLSAL